MSDPAARQAAALAERRISVGDVYSSSAVTDTRATPCAP